MSASPEYIRRCPSCETENAAQTMRCACGALLTGIDLSLSAASVLPLAPIAPLADTQSGAAVLPLSAELICSYADCAQTNPAGSDTCLYCNRPLLLAAGESAATAGTHLDQMLSLLSLPSALKNRYRILRPLLTQGAEAELLLVQELASNTQRIAKIYRHGIQVKAEVQQRVANIPAEHRVLQLEIGLSDGYAFEVMEFCELGSLRQLLQDKLAQAQYFEAESLALIVQELSSAIASVHAAGLLHRDLKPENILIRTLEPLDLVLTDFGISSVLDATQKLTGMARTLPYASPESLSGVIDAKADFWALGMIMLELASGRHPFSGLSEAVILHQLTTREIEINVVQDSYLRKLLRGLLLRDPQARWGAAQIQRWLARDASLPDPVDNAMLGGFREPYHIGADVCHTQQQLAVGLARNWSDGVGDIANGQLLAWFRDVQKDQNATRVLLALRHEKRLSIDVQLLQLILHLAPGIPPVWRGVSIELPVILAYANKALKDDAEAAQWLHDLYLHKVLEAYAEAGNAATASIVQNWQQACSQFEQAWQTALKLLKQKSPKHLPGEYVNVDKLMYGLDEHQMPALRTMHAQILAMAYDAQWSERLRQRLIVAYAGLMAYCPWLIELGQIADMQAAHLLVLEALLPEARRVAERQQKAHAFEKNAEQENTAGLKQDLSMAINAIRSAANANFFEASATADLRSALDRYFEMLAQIRAAGQADPAWLEMKKTALKVERSAVKMLGLVDTLAERRVQNTGWFSREMLIAFMLAAFILPMLLRGSALGLLALAFLGMAAWRLLPNFLTLREIRKLARSM
ncbi:protein kinase [Undibacterium sp.]|uniref:protein kinase domain-containing protein n=1 Tax=Undibacterium sp. TaxID=1914977 RepID=UPI0025EA00E3|nr:protein kinase [Undibacterium sp.]